MQRIDETLERIGTAPRRFPRVHWQLRRAIVKQFPFAIFYKETKDEILVFAVFHSRRDPKHLTSRLKHLSNSDF